MKGSALIPSDISRAGRVFIGCEGSEPELTRAIKRVGNRPFLYSSDFPHEVNSEFCKNEIRELLEDDEMTAEDKEAVLHGNSERFYNLTSSVGKSAAFQANL